MPNHKHVYQCRVCKRNHPLRLCAEFLAMPVTERRHQARKHEYCENCLAKSHTVRQCMSLSVCKICKKLHHTLLHQLPHNQIDSSSRRLTAQHRLSTIRSKQSVPKSPAPSHRKVKQRLGGESAKNKLQSHMNQVFRSLQSLKECIQLSQGERRDEGPK